MNKIRLKVSAFRIYEADPEHYEGCDTPQQMADLDATGDVWSLLDHEETIFNVEPYPLQGE